MQQKMSDGGVQVANVCEQPKVGYLSKSGETFLGLAFLSGGISIGTAAVLIPRILQSPEIVNLRFNFFLVYFSLFVLCSILTPILIWIGVPRKTKGAYSTLLPDNIFRVESAYMKGRDLYVVVSGENSGPSFVYLKSSPKIEIIGFPERTIGPDEFYLEVERHHTITSGVKRGDWHESQKTWRTYTFIPRKVDAPEPAPETV